MKRSKPPEVAKVKWTRKQPNRNGRWWAAVAFREGSKRFYYVKLTEVFGCQEGGKVGPHASAFWGGALPLHMLRKTDIWWASDPIPEPEAPPFRPSRRRILE